MRERPVDAAEHARLACVPGLALLCSTSAAFAQSEADYSNKPIKSWFGSGAKVE